MTAQGDRWHKGISPQMDFESHIFWTASGQADTTIPDPLGLDSLRERLSDKLVPYLTTRTARPEDAFWCLVLLRWSRTPRVDEHVREFLRWERYLKILWAHTGYDKRTGSPRSESFTGIDQARLQSKEYGASTLRFTPLLKNQRAQGMLGAYNRMLLRLELVHEGLELTDLGRSWTEGAGDSPELQDGDWESWRSGFAKAFSAFRPFRDRLRRVLHCGMPRLHRGLVSAGWTEDANWAHAAKYMGPDRRWAIFANNFCYWADRLRESFDDLVKDPKCEDVSFPGPLAVPAKLQSDLPWQHWKMVLRYNALGDAKTKKAGLLAEWHKQELKSRKYRMPDMWLVGGDHGIESRPYNASPRNTEGSDCRWSNAVHMMGPG